jgi:hypothetical protein
VAAERMTFTVPAKVKKRARARRDVNWSAIVAKAIEDKLTALEIADRVFAKSRLTNADVDEFADLIDKAMLQRFRGKA